MRGLTGVGDQCGPNEGIMPRLLEGLGGIGRILLLEQRRVSQLGNLDAPPSHALGRQSMEPGI